MTETTGTATGTDYQHGGTVAEEWDRRYADAERIWSGRPNGQLVTETAGLTPGRVLDVGCGEGADAVWLAERGWQVTALDVSKLALDRASAHARQAGVTVHWLHSGLEDAGLPAASFDLVSAQYAALFKTADRKAEHVLLDVVAPGGVLLVVHHLPPTAGHAHTHGFNPDDYVNPADVAALLDGHWQIEVDQTRPRSLITGAGAQHTEDVVLRARRLD